MGLGPCLDLLHIPEACALLQMESCALAFVLASSADAPCDGMELESFEMSLASEGG